MPPKLPKIFRLGPWSIEPLAGAVTGPNGETQHLEPKVMDVLVCLTEHINEIVTRQQLLDAAWSSSTGSDDQLTRAIGELRRVLQDNPANPKYIQTVPKRGYRLIGVAAPADASKPTTNAVPSWQSSYFFGKKLRFVVAAILALGLIYLVIEESKTIPVRENASTNQKSIAVLPFLNMSADPGNEYFSDGLSEEIRTMLVRIPELKVIGRTSSFAFKGKNVDLRIIGQSLNVKTVLEGSVRQSGDRVRVTAQLVDVSDGTYIWSDSFDRTITDIFSIQDEIAAAIIDALKIHIVKNPTRGRPTEVAEAYALFLKARALLSHQDTKSAESALLEAVELDPKFAEAFEMLAHLYWLQDLPELTLAEARKLMQESASKAIAIDPGLVLAQALYELERDDGKALPDVINSLTNALRDQPNDAAILRTLTWELLISGYLNEALRVAEQFVEVDPLSSIAHVRHCAALRAVGRLDESLAALKAAALLTPDNLDWYFGEANLARGRNVAAKSYFEASLRTKGITDLDWIAELVTHGQDTESGAKLLTERIPLIVQSVRPDDPEDFQDALNRWHLFFGHLDRYYEIILGRIPDLSTRAGAIMFLWYGTLNRDSGFTAHPQYLDVAEKMGLVDIWERRGAPDFCRKLEDNWVCE